MKLINFKCTKCETEEEILYSSTEKIPSEIKCSQCWAIAKQWNFKSNSQKWRYNDGGYKGTK